MNSKKHPYQYQHLPHLPCFFQCKHKCQQQIQRNHAQIQPSHRLKKQTQYASHNQTRHETQRKKLPQRRRSPQFFVHQRLKQPVLVKHLSHFPHRVPGVIINHQRRNQINLPSILDNPPIKLIVLIPHQLLVTQSDFFKQSVESFRLLGEVLGKEGFLWNMIVRQWNYIEKITAFDGADQHYQAFNNVRSDFYGKAEWSNGYPAATGIGANLGGILIDVDAVQFISPDVFSSPIDNRLQVAAHAYSERVLATSKEKKTTPKFERAKSISFQDRKLIYISGTAAIRGEESLVDVGLERQLRITMENIAELIGDASLKVLRVYLKNKSDYEEAMQLMESYDLNIPISYMWADVCRDELLVEIEGIAIR